jgi:ABC-type nickel/cobalt efflux system permease component RcnA
MLKWAAWGVGGLLAWVFYANQSEIERGASLICLVIGIAAWHVLKEIERLREEVRESRNALLHQAGTARRPLDEMD